MENRPSQVINLVIIIKILWNSSLSQSLENPLSPFTAKNSGLKTQSYSFHGNRKLLNHLSSVRGSPVANAVDSSVTENSKDPTLAVCPSKPKANYKETASSWPCKLVKNECHPARMNISLHAINSGMANNCSYSEGSCRLSIAEDREREDSKLTAIRQSIRRQGRTSSIFLFIGNGEKLEIARKNDDKGW